MSWQLECIKTLRVTRAKDVVVQGKIIRFGEMWGEEKRDDFENLIIKAGINEEWLEETQHGGMQALVVHALTVEELCDVAREVAVKRAQLTEEGNMQQSESLIYTMRSLVEQTATTDLAFLAQLANPYILDEIATMEIY